jgi:hypothetical protein
MARKKRIIRRIRRFVRQNSFLQCRFGNWYVGVTCEVDRRIRQHALRTGMELEIVEAWQAKSAREAADIERTFLQMGMDGAGGGWTDRSKYVYVFKFKGPYAG